MKESSLVHFSLSFKASLVAQTVEPPAMQETQV